MMTFLQAKSSTKKSFLENQANDVCWHRKLCLRRSLIKKVDQKPTWGFFSKIPDSSLPTRGGGTPRGQVSTEMLIAVIIVLFLFVIVQLFIEQTKQDAQRNQQNVQEDEVCAKLSTIITYMSSNPPYTETTLELLLDTNIVNGSIFVGDSFCGFLGRAQNVQLYPGVIKAFDVNGIVVLTNDTNYSPLSTPSSAPGSTSNQSGGILLLTDDQNNSWSSEVQADDASYAASPDNQTEDPDWVEFRFSNLGLTQANLITDVRFLAKHFESSHLGLNDNKNRVQCWDGSTWADVNAYVPVFTETYYQSGNLVSCVSDWNAANNARFRMTYEPNGVGDTISIDYGRVDVNYSQVGSLINLWEVLVDLPQPLDFRTDINSTANTFGSGAGNDGWDWNVNNYGGTLASAVLFNADLDYDGNIFDSNVSNAKRLEIKFGGGVSGAPTDPDDNSTFGMAASGAYGIQFDINADQWSLIQGGDSLLLSFTYTIDADAGWGNGLDAGEEGWVKVRFGLDDSSMTFLGSDLDQNVDEDASNEIWWSYQPTDYTAFFYQDVSSLVSGAGTYYLDIGGGLSDWDTRTEGMGIYIDNINLVVI
jgi:hypothetical protein